MFGWPSGGYTPLHPYARLAGRARRRRSAARAERAIASDCSLTPQNGVAWPTARRHAARMDRSPSDTDPFDRLPPRVGPPANRRSGQATAWADRDPPGTLMRRLRDAAAMRHHGPRTVEVYQWWARRFVRFHDLRHPAALGASDIAALLSELAVRGAVSASTQNQARAALGFLYAHVLQMRVDPPRTRGPREASWD